MPPRIDFSNSLQEQYNALVTYAGQSSSLSGDRMAVIKSVGLMVEDFLAIVKEAQETGKVLGEKGGCIDLFIRKRIAELMSEIRA